jgi:hypothetical protein
MMDFIFKEWQKKLSDFESSVKKDLAEIRKCKAEIQKMKQDTEFEKRRGRYIHDEERLILSAPEIIIGNVDDSGIHFDGTGSVVTVRGSQVNVQGIGKGGQVLTRSQSIRQIAEDPGCDGLEHVVGTRSEVVSQARHIVLHSQADEGVFSEEPSYPKGSTGVRIHADEKIEVDASVSAENRREQLLKLYEKLKSDQIELEQKSARHKTSLELMVTLMEKLLGDKKKISEKDKAVRACYEDMEKLNGQIEELSLSLSEEVCCYADVLSVLSETSRQLKCVETQQKNVKDAEKFKKETTGTSVAVTGEVISLESRDGDGHLRENKEAKIQVMGRMMELLAQKDDHSLMDDGQVSLAAKTVVVDQQDFNNAKYDDNGNLESAEYPVEGTFAVKAKNIYMGAIDQELKDGVIRDKEQGKDGFITLQAQHINVDTSKVQNTDYDKEGNQTKGEYLADGEVTINSKTITMGAVDSDYDANDPHLRKEKALTEGASIKLRSECMTLDASTTDGKATGIVNLNAKNVNLLSMDFGDNSQSLTEKGKIQATAERIYLGESKDESLMSHKVQAWAEKITLLGSKVMQAIQGDKKSEDNAFLLLKDQEAKLKGKKSELHGPTEVVGDITLHKTTVGDFEIKGELKSNYIGGGVTAGPSPKSTLTPDTGELKDNDNDETK